MQYHIYGIVSEYPDEGTEAFIIALNEKDALADFAADTGSDDEAMEGYSVYEVAPEQTDGLDRMELQYFLNGYRAALDVCAEWVEKKAADRRANDPR